jgi:energy-coupling factor transport system ATP-binding protein
MRQGIQLYDVCFSFYEPTLILSHVTLSITPGEFVGIVGPNGSGKTTIAKLINGDLLPISGSVLVDGLDTNISSDLKNIKQLVSTIHADPENQLVTPTVYDELAFSLQAMHLDVKEISRRCEGALDRFDLRQYRNLHPFCLSVGEQFRLLLAASLIRQPKYVVLDETFSMMDSPTRYEFFDTLSQVCREAQLGLIQLTHRMDDLISADRIIVLGSGEVVRDGPMKAIFSEMLQNKSWQIEVPLIYQVIESVGEKSRHRSSIS